MTNDSVRNELRLNYSQVRLLPEIEQILQSINRAVKAEEKQGYINTGAIGGFSSYLYETLNGLDYAASPRTLAKIRAITQEYSRTSPYKRRGLLAELKIILAKMPLFSDDSMPQGEPPQQSLAEQVSPDKQRVPAAIPKAPAENPNNMTSELQYIKGVGPYRAKQFENLGILTVEDLLRHFPRRYEVRSKKKIEDLRDGELVTICGRVSGSQISRGRVKVVKMNLEQDGRSIYAIWFNQVHIPKQFPEGTEVSVTGKVQWNRRVPELLATEIVKGHDGLAEEIVPVYPETARLNSKIIRGVMKTGLPQIEKFFPEIFPDHDLGLMIRAQAFREIHFPSCWESMQQARARLVVEEILFVQLAMARLRSPRKEETSPVIRNGGELVRSFVSQLPFQLTGAQKRVITEIFKDMEQGKKAMTRLVQGDVGSGKTVVAMAAMLQAVGSGFQAAMMAPTEILAGQHYESLKTAFSPLQINVALLVGGQNKTERESILGQIMSGKAQVVVGTHAIIQETVRFNCLGLVVTDEQHRFGVRQRSLLEDKGENPHVLVMTATPIPRTLALTLYGDLQLSVLDEMPAGRKPIITRKITERNRPGLEKFLDQQMAEGRQIYVVCPLVEETEKSDLASATRTAEMLKERFQNRKVALLHGRIKGQEKELIMQEYRKGEIDILVATTVVEVGVNVPNASVMVVEDAERYGLAQLHQLRGRVGRGSEQSYCILVSKAKDNARLNILCQTEDGFKIAEEDLKIRGPGELLGLRQHGVPELKLTDLSKDGKYVEKAYRILQDALAKPEQYLKVYQEAERLYPLHKVGVN